MKNKPKIDVTASIRANSKSMMTVVGGQSGIWGYHTDPL